MLCRPFLIFALLLSLSACGPDDNATPLPSSNANAASDSAATDAAAALPVFASDPVASAQASLDADSRQVPPVLSYAPDSDDTAHH
ncbi:hypothetical protein AWB80_06654 [Caballeronia pedi]|uniref:Lipoprotein n=1 Tax=Caballeronia pedi TaxID=1777141 RepID=A0A158DCC3_9BURK|nr:hypothetical protein [Caballeronia pedi]SAK92294.1 hypothetical protein AWB80_06654 [Caballeronia pedi]